MRVCKSGIPGTANYNFGIVVFDFFCGCGGTSRGFQKAGLDIGFALDNDPLAEKTFRRNFPSATFLNIDINQLGKGVLTPILERYPNHKKLFCGCAPCQPFTKQKTKKKARAEDARFNLLIAFAKVIAEYKPDFVFVENVPGVQAPSDEPGPFMEFLKQLESMSYKPDYSVVAAQDYGAAQMRQRFVFMASRLGAISIPPASHGNVQKDKDVIPYKTVRDAITDLPPIKAGTSYIDKSGKIHNHCAASLSNLNLKRIMATPHNGGGRLSWPDKLKLKCHTKKVEIVSDAKGKKKTKTHSGHTDVYGRLWWDRPAPGLTTRCISYSNGRFGHPEQNRAISIREAARLQGFDDDFIFEGNLVSMSRQIGNAVPIALAQAMGQRFMECVVHIAVRENNNGKI